MACAAPWLLCLLLGVVAMDDGKNLKYWEKWSDAEIAARKAEAWEDTRGRLRPLLPGTCRAPRWRRWLATTMGMLGRLYPARRRQWFVVALPVSLLCPRARLLSSRLAMGVMLWMSPLCLAIGVTLWMCPLSPLPPLRRLPP